MKYQREIDEYLRAYPGLLKWVNQCLACRGRGLNPEMPSQIYPWRPTGADHHLPKMFDELPLSESGLCESCEDAIDGSRGV